MVDPTEEEIQERAAAVRAAREWGWTGAGDPHFIQPRDPREPVIYEDPRRQFGRLALPDKDDWIGGPSFSDGRTVECVSETHARTLMEMGW